MKTCSRTFWENHDPTQGMRQGGDIGTQYRSGIYVTSDAQAAAAVGPGRPISRRWRPKGLGTITTEIGAAGPFYFAEDYHQQYLAKNPEGYCGIGGTGVVCPMAWGCRELLNPLIPAKAGGGWP
jgi:peptide-methionine (S)-S-oxide reductase